MIHQLLHWKKLKKPAQILIQYLEQLINEFGLLHAVESYKLQKSLTLRFIQLSVKEYLAAYHIICLQQNEELIVLWRYLAI